MEIEKDWKEIKCSEDEKIMMKYVNYAKNFCICDWSLYSSTCFAYFLQFFITIYSQSSEDRVLLIRATYPFDLNPLPIFTLASIFQTVLLALWASTNALSETLLGTLIFHLVGRIEVLLKNISEVSFSYNSSTDNRCLAIFIKRIVREHRKLILMRQKIEAIYSYICLVQFLSSTTLLCLTGVLIITPLLNAFKLTGFGEEKHGLFPFLNSNILSVGTLDVILMIKYITHMFLMLLQAFAFCFSGEILLSKSLSIPQTLSNCTWYETTPGNVKLLLMVIMRTQKPMILTVGKFTELSIGSFTRILQTSASYLSVLRTAY